ncbi:T9SS type A sorting domain-containing protein [Tenacibaculum piscium]|uniref:T9SS type A sorting domain-containing protein n=1 Tax=Tenacibaculum piscium TaxID=1458515 RepID=UPI001EFB24AB|nr:T9SS type A sorting domain-containing protein [Tenacibaculum piscium]MCG8184071.1 Ig-like domain-containing protein [Tenacibaculum piscium]MCG8205464.1 Ig-like domain-containing protein [Tenacibaculum piscium]
MKTITKKIKSIAMLLVMALIGSSAKAQVTIPTNDLVWEYKLENNLNETSGKSFNAGVLTASGSNHTFITGSTPDMGNNAISAVKLSGDNLANTGNVSFASNVKLFTLSFWVKLPPTFGMNTQILKVKDPNTNNFIKIGSNGTSFYADLKSPSSSFANSNMTTSTPLTNITNNSWHHIAVKGAYWAGGAKYYNQLYIDGVKVNEKFFPTNLNNVFIFGGTDIIIGNDASTNDVQIDNLRFYKTALPDADITSLYNERNQKDTITSISIQGQGGATAITTANGTLQMEATILPSTVSQNVNWSVDNTTVATIDANGLLTAVGNGAVVVNAVATGNANFFATKTIIVSGQSQQANCTNAVIIPDANFRTALFALNVDSNNDGTICQDEAQAFTGNIDVSNKNISDLTGIEAFTSITQLEAYDNSITSIDVTSLTNLTRLHIGGNQLTGVLDVSHLPNLTEFFCYNNNLTGLNIANGNNANFVYMKAYSNANLTCIQKDASYTPATINVGIYDTGWTSNASYSDNCNFVASCTNIVNIPDANFKNALLAHGTTITGTGISTIDTDGDGEICETEAQAYTGYIKINSKSITDATGLEAFVNITQLNCYNNQLTSLDVSANTVLTYLNCYNNQLTSLDVSANTVLTQLSCSANQLTSLDVSANTVLTKLSCSTNQLTSLDVSTNTVLTQLYCNTNQLTSLNIANGNNTNMSYMQAQGNSNLTCIQTDIGIVGTTPNGWQKDATASYSNSCVVTTQWTGTTNTNWNEASNWSNGVPSENISVLIPAGITVYPQVNSGLSKVQNLEIQTGASLTIPTGNSLIVTQNLTQNGTLTIHSDANSNGELLVKGNQTGNQTGNASIDYKRYLTTNWHLISAPVIGQNINDFTNDLAKNGLKYGVATYDNSLTSNRYVHYTEPTGTNSIASAGAFDTGKGYSIKKQTAGVLTFSGTLQNATVSKAITNNSSASGTKWNLIGNPFTASINANQKGVSSSDFLTINQNELDPNNIAIYLWNSSNNSYDIINHATASKKIAPGQAFFVASKASSGQVQFTKNMQHETTSSRFLRESNQNPSIDLTISNGRQLRTTQIKYLEKMTADLDKGYDAGAFLTNTTFDVFTKLASNNNTTNFALQCLPNENYENMIIPVGVNAQKGTEIALSANALHLPEGIKVYLEDRQKNSFTQIDTTSYKIQLDTAVNGVGRFYLHTTYRDNNQLITSDIQDEIQVFLVEKNKLKVTTKKAGQNMNIAIFDVLGRKVFDSKVISKNYQEFSLSTLKTGIYIVNIQQDNFNAVSKKISIR